MHLIVLVETDAQHAFRARREVSGQGVRLIEEGIAGLHPHAQLVLARANLYLPRFEIMIPAKDSHFLFWRALELAVEDRLIVHPNRYIRLWNLLIDLNVDGCKMSG